MTRYFAAPGRWPVRFDLVVGLLTALLLVACTSQATPSRSAGVPTTLPSPSPEPMTPSATALASPSAPAPTSSPIAVTTFTGPDSTFKVRLASTLWEKDRGDDPTALYLVRRDPFHRPAMTVSIRIGDADGRVRTCDRPVRSFPGSAPERCEVVVATSMEELRDATEELLDATFGWFNFEPKDLDGDPAAWVGWSGYEYPARGGQGVAYLFAMHDTRPVVVRFWTGNNSGRPAINDVVAGFRWVD